jgi:hypothetical protein
MSGFIKDAVGNMDLLKMEMTAFLCSRKISVSVVMECYDWAIQQRMKGACVISGFHSRLERDIFELLWEGKQPIIHVLNRGLKSSWDQKTQSLLDSGRLLIITPFGKEIERGTEETGMIRNRLVLDLAHNVKYGHISENGNLKKLVQTSK